MQFERTYRFSLCFCLLGIFASASEPNAVNLAQKASAAIESGDLAGAITHLRRAIRLAESDTPKAFNSSVNAVVSNQALAHGSEQFRRLARDRPAIVQYEGAKNFENLKDWVIKQFAGEGTGFVIYWDDADPVSAALGGAAEHSFPIPGSPVYIRVAKTVPKSIPGAAQQPIPFERLWNSLAFEFLNLTYWKRREHLRKSAIEGEISKSQFVTEFFYTEYRAIRDTQSFYCDVYLPWTLEAQVRSEPSYWYIDETWWRAPEEVLDNYPFSSAYPWGYFGHMFEMIRRDPDAKPRRTQKHLNDRNSTKKPIINDANCLK